jgi:hypothetical protein
MVRVATAFGEQQVMVHERMQVRMGLPADGDDIRAYLMAEPDMHQIISGDGIPDAGAIVTDHRERGPDLVCEPDRSGETPSGRDGDMDPTVHDRLQYRESQRCDLLVCSKQRAIEIDGNGLDGGFRFHVLSMPKTSDKGNMGAVLPPPPVMPLERWWDR